MRIISISVLTTTILAMKCLPISVGHPLTARNSESELVEEISEVVDGADVDDVPVAGPTPVQIVEPSASTPCSSIGNYPKEFSQVCAI